MKKSPGILEILEIFKRYAKQPNPNIQKSENPNPDLKLCYFLGAYQN